LRLTPTAYGGWFLDLTEPSSAMSAAFRAAGVASGARHELQYDDLVRRVLKSGTTSGAGSDMCWACPRRTRDEASTATLLSLRQAGVPPLDVIRAVTTSDAVCAFLTPTRLLESPDPDELPTNLSSIKRWVVMRARRSAYSKDVRPC
jgi:hypothetical protein